MDRRHFVAFLQDSSGTVVEAATVYIYLAGTTTAATIYASETGVTAIVQPILTTSTGLIEFWVDVDDYALETQKFRLCASKTALTSLDIDNIDMYQSHSFLVLSRTAPYLMFKGIETTGPPTVADKSTSLANQIYRIIEEDGVLKFQFSMGESLVAAEYEWVTFLSYSLWGKTEVHQPGTLRIPGITDELEGLKARLLHVESLAHTA